MVSRQVIDHIITKCSLKDILRRFQKKVANEEYLTENISLEPIVISENLVIDDEEEIKRHKGIVTDGYNPEILYGAIEMHQDRLQKTEASYTLEEFGGINNYACNEYKLINGSIYDTPYYEQRKKDSPNIDNWINMRKEQMDRAIERSPPLDVDVTLFRYGDFFEGMKVGDTGKFKGYTSTSLQEATAEQFKNGYYGDTKNRFKITIRANKGQKGILLNDTFETVKEHEWLLPRNQKFIVLGIDYNTKEVEIGLY